MPTKFRTVTDLLPGLNRTKENVVLTEEIIPGVPTISSPVETVTEEARVELPPLAPISLAEPAVPEHSEPRTTGAGLHDILKNTDYWFNLELSQLEKYAVTSATLHAQAGLPRQQAPASEELPAEQILRVRAIELFVEWAARVRRKVQDAIQSSSVSAGAGVMQLRHGIEQLEQTSANAGRAGGSLAAHETATSTKEKEVTYSRQLGTVPFFILLGLLTVVDWVANVPVFTELLPKDPGSDQRWQDLVAASEHFGASSGMVSLWHRIYFYPEVSMLALGVVIFLMFLGHMCGKSLRKIAAFPADSDIAPILKSQRRQAWIPCIGAGFAICLVLLFLFLSRGQIKGQTEQRFQDANKQVQVLEEQSKTAQAAGDSEQIEQTQTQLDDARALRKDLGLRVNYASGISAMNLPILLLNIVLAITAVGAAYLHDEAPLVEVDWADPKSLELKNKLAQLGGSVAAQAASLQQVDATIQADIARARYLASTPPLREWPAKAKRLESVVQLFRAENARERGIDVQNIVAFQRQWPMELPEIDENGAFHLPEEMAAYEVELAGLRSRLAHFQDKLFAESSGVQA